MIRRPVAGEQPEIPACSASVIFSQASLRVLAFRQCVGHQPVWIALAPAPPQPGGPRRARRDLAGECNGPEDGHDCCWHNFVASGGLWRRRRYVAAGYSSSDGYWQPTKHADHHRLHQN